jgi:manganese transport protein
MASDISAEQVPSLEEIHSSVPIPASGWRRFLAFSGPALMVSVGYMDPGNWGADLEAGSRFGYRLLWVLVLSNLMAVLLQSLATRLGVVTGRDLAQACRDAYPRWTAVGLWLLTEVAIAATDLAEVIGTVVALKLFGVPYLVGLVIAAGDTLLLLAVQRRRVRLLELLTLALVGVIAVSFAVELFKADHRWRELLHGLVPGFDPDQPQRSLYVAMAMLGATVMPHNLYLHSALVQTRAFPKTEEGKRLACRYNLVDSVLALNGALFINVAILVLAASTFTKPIESLTEAPQELKAIWGPWAAVLFAVALLASGQSSTLTGTLAGQVVMEGFVHLRIRPWLRRLVTRLAAIVPALVILSPSTSGPDEAVDSRIMELLVLSQAILSFQLPFAILPLVQLTSDRRHMGPFASTAWLKAVAWACAALVVGLNVILIWQTMEKWAESAEQAGWGAGWIYGTVGPLAVLLAIFLGWVAVYPYYRRREPEREPLPPLHLPEVRYQRIGVAVEFTAGDSLVLAQAAALARLHQSPLLLIHVVEGMGAAMYGAEADDRESRSDRAMMAQLVEHLRGQKLQADGMLGYGNPPDELVRLARLHKVDLLVLGTHGHGFFADLALGQTVSPVLHRLSIPILVVSTLARPTAR